MNHLQKLKFYRSFGALTIKHYAFKARPWEIQSSLFFDITEIGGSLLRVEYRGNMVFRIFLKENTLSVKNGINMNKYLNYWVTDRTRFYYTAFNNFRLLKSFLIFKENVCLLSKDLTFNILFFFKQNVLFFSKLNVLYFFLSCFNLINFVTIYHNFFNCFFNFVKGQFFGLSFLSNLKRFNFMVGNFFFKANDLDFCLSFSDAFLLQGYRTLLLVDLNLRFNFPLLTLYIRESIRFGILKNIFIFGRRCFSFFSKVVGTSTFFFIKFLKGSSWLNLYFKKYAESLIFCDFFFFRGFRNFKFFEYLNFNFLSLEIGDLIKNELSFFDSNIVSLNLFLKSNISCYWFSSQNFNIFFNSLENIKKYVTKGDVNIFCGSQSPTFISGLHFKIPLYSILEKKDFYLRFDGSWFSTVEVLPELRSFDFNFFLLKSLKLSNKCFLFYNSIRNVIFFTFFYFLFNLDLFFSFFCFSLLLSSKDFFLDLFIKSSEVLFGIFDLYKKNQRNY